MNIIMNKKAYILLTALILVGAGCAQTQPAAPAQPQQPAAPAAVVPEAPAEPPRPTAANAPASSAPAAVPRPTIAAPSATPAPAAGQAAVTISNFAFNPPSLTVSRGSTVVWTNQDSVTHSVKTVSGGDTAGLGSDSASPDLNPGDTYSLTFTKAGTYDYRCGIHASMTGSITVTP